MLGFVHLGTFFFGLEMLFLRCRKTRETTTDNIINKRSLEKVKWTCAFKGFDRNRSRPVKLCEGAHTTISTAKIQFLSENHGTSDTLVLLFSESSRKVRNLHFEFDSTGKAGRTECRVALSHLMKGQLLHGNADKIALYRIVESLAHGLDSLLNVHGSNCSLAA